MCFVLDEIQNIPKQINSGRGNNRADGASQDEPNLLGETSNGNLPNEIMNRSQQINPRNRKRGPRRKIQEPQMWKRNIRKRLRNSGDAYISVSGKSVAAKSFDNTDCQCTRECHKLIPIQQREKLFNDYYKLGSFDLKTAYLSGQIKVVNKIRNTTNSQRKQYTRIYNLPNENGVDVPVCKAFFKKVLAVSDGRLTRALKGKQTGGTPCEDKRGKHEPYNKTSPERVAEVVKFISLFPKYQSHYSRKKNPNRMYLAPTLNIVKMYNMYKEKSEKAVSQRIFRHIFNTKFNLKFHAPVSDSCKTCDNLEQGIKFGKSVDIINQLTVQRELHLRKAEAARSEMRNDSELAKVPENDVTTIAFDLMSTLPTPHISTGICYYKRQLWTYCLGIHNLSTNEAHMYMWNESIASRGPQEIGSCLLHYIKNNVLTSKLIMYSDQCGGQNRNIKMSVLCDYILKTKINNLSLIDHKFMVSGHSYLACDRDFGVIEKHKRKSSDIYVPKDWVKIVRESRKKNPFVVIEMEAKDFISTKVLETNVTNRKHTTEKAPLNWLKIQWLRYRADSPSEFFFKESNQSYVEFQAINVKKRNGCERKLSEQLPLLYPNGRKIDVKKFKDLKDLLPYIPPILHQFYTDLEEGQDQDDRDEDDMELISIDTDIPEAITVEQSTKRKPGRPPKNNEEPKKPKILKKPKKSP